MLGSLSLSARNNFFCGSLLLLFFPNPPFLDGSAFFRCFFGVRRKEFFLFRRLMSGLGRVLVWFWAEIGQDNVLTFLFFFRYDKYMKNLGGHNSYEKRSHLRKERFFQRRFAPYSNRSLQKIRRRQRLYRRPYLCRQLCLGEVGKTPRPAKASQRYKFMLGNGHYSRPFTLFQRTPRIYQVYAKAEHCGQTDHDSHRTKGGFTVKVVFYCRISKELLYYQGGTK